jgi:hypothetical protein
MLDYLIGLLVTIPIVIFTLCFLVVVWTFELIFILVCFLIANPHILLVLILLFLLF